MAELITWQMLQTQHLQQARPSWERYSQEARAQVRMRQTRQVLIHLLPKLPQHTTCELQDLAQRLAYKLVHSQG